MDEPTSFDSWADEYDAELSHGLAVSGEDKNYFADARVAFLRACLDDQGFNPSTVLDFGCGTGTATPFLIGHLGCQSLLGVDLSARSIALAAKTHAESRSRFQTLDSFIPSGAFDLGYTNGVFHHIPPTERSSAASLLLHSLRPGGYLALWENNKWSPAARYVMSRVAFDRGVTPLSAPETRSLLRSVGFEIVRTDFLFIFPAVLSWLRFLERPLSRLPFGAQFQVLARRPVQV